MLVNGHHQETIAITDRALHYGDGVFETVLVHARKPVLWQQHLHRLQHGCQHLQIPLDTPSLQAEVAELLNTHSLSHGVLKILVSRGSGGRGYLPPATPMPTRVLQMHPMPEDYPHHSANGIHVTRCQHPLSVNPALAGLKHLNRLDQVLASIELAPVFQEGLMCSPDGQLIEGIKSNVFVHDRGTWMTPDLQQCGVAGVMRAWVLQQIPQTQIRALGTDEVLAAQEMFVCNSIFGIWPVTQLHWGSHMRQLAIGEQTRHLQALFEGCKE